jgi:tRNA (cytidine56-2'-O)-methyltransferase
MNVVILRLFHRKSRDKRVTTHCMLVGRAFGCSGMYYCGEEDIQLHYTLDKVCQNWGGNFFLKHIDEPKELIKRWKGKGGEVVHLTMYGINIPRLEEKIKNLHLKKDLLVVIGGSKVPLDFYKIADLNIAIGHQPHSEIAALALFLDRIFSGKELEIEFKDAKFKIIEQNHAKKVTKIS